MEEPERREIMMKTEVFIFPHDYVSRSFQLDSFRSGLNPSFFPESAENTQIFKTRRDAGHLLNSTRQH